MYGELDDIAGVSPDNINTGQSIVTFDHEIELGDLYLI